MIPQTSRQAGQLCAPGSASASAKPGRPSPSVDVLLRGIAKSYGRARVLDGIDFSIGRGEFVTLLGPSGSGKTTLLMCVAGFVAANEGKILFDDSDVTRLPPEQRNIGMVFQNYALFPHMTVAGNVAYPLRARRLGRAEIEERVAGALDRVQLGQFLDRYPDQLSGGQRQRVALARALVFEPALLLMDEPLSALDKSLREQMQFEIRELQQRLGITTISVTHDQREALTMADKVAILRDGRLVQVGSAQEVFERPANSFVATFVGDSTTVPVMWRENSLWAGRTQIVVPTAENMGSGAKCLVVRADLACLLAEPVRAMNCLPGQLVSCLYQGSEMLYSVALESGPTVSVRQKTHSIDSGAFRPGMTVFVGLDIHHTLVVPSVP